MELARFLNGGFQPKRYRPGGIGNWSGHLPFAADLVAALRPSLLVELGTHYGESYFGFCQAVRENDIACSCYAVDTWVGEPQAGFYDESVYQEVSAYNAANYSDFSYLLRTTFDEAAPKFAEDSIELLHIDGLHTYQAVSHDFTSWLKKVKPGGVVLMHDIMVRHADFGVWKLWDELAPSGQQFTFRHGWGLGVFRKAGSDVQGNGFFDVLFNAPAEIREHARKFYALCATKLEREHERTNSRSGADKGIVVDIYPFGNNGYKSETCLRLDAKAGRWEHLSTELLQGVGNGPLRIDPTEQPALIEVSGISLRRPIDGEVLWGAHGPEELAALSAGGDLIRLDEAQRTDSCRFFSYGPDPQLVLPLLDARRFDQPLLLDIWLRVQTDMASVLPLLQEANERRGRMQSLESELHEARNHALADHENVSAELTAVKRERETLAGEHEALLATLRRLQSDLYVCKTDLKNKTTEETQLRSELASEREQLAESRRVLQEALSSRSWRITKPIRKMSEILGAQR